MLHVVINLFNITYIETEHVVASTYIAVLIRTLTMTVTPCLLGYYITYNLSCFYDLHYTCLFLYKDSNKKIQSLHSSVYTGKSVGIR